jgi:hypothetical protein
MRRQSGATLTAVVVALALMPTPGESAELGTSEVWSLEAHGFVSQGFLYSTHQNNYLAYSSHGSFEFTEVGLNFNKQLTDNFKLGLQLFMRDLGPLGNYSLKADWFHVDYRWRDWFGIRAGRVKLPFGLYNDTSDIDAARVPVLLPQSIYPAQNRDFLLAQTGVELYGYLDLGAAGALDYRLYGGTIYADLNSPRGSPLQVNELTTPYVVGGRLLWEAPGGLRLGGSLQALELDAKLQMSGGAPFEVRIPAVLWVASVEFTHQEWLAVAEYSRWHVNSLSSDPAVFPSTFTESERAYAMLNYRLGSWFSPGFYYSVLFRDVTARYGRSAQQHDVALTARFDINPHWLMKLEAHYLNGTAALSTALNDNRPLGALANDWALFVIKTTGHF